VNTVPTAGKRIDVKGVFYLCMNQSRRGRESLVGPLLFGIFVFASEPAGTLSAYVCLLVLLFDECITSVCLALSTCLNCARDALFHRFWINNDLRHHCWKHNDCFRKQRRSWPGCIAYYSTDRIVSGSHSKGAREMRDEPV